MTYTYTIVAVTENTFGVLQRIASIFTRNRLNVERLEVAEIKTGISKFKILVHCAPTKIEKIVKQLKRIVELFDVKIIRQDPQLKIVEMIHPQGRFHSHTGRS